MPKIDRQMVFERYGGYCGYCGTGLELKAMQIDHIFPKSMANILPEMVHIDDWDNLASSCRSCNNYKGGDTSEGFRERLKDQVRMARDHSLNFRLAERFGLVSVTEQPVAFYMDGLIVFSGVWAQIHNADRSNEFLDFRHLNRLEDTSDEVSGDE